MKKGPVSLLLTGPRTEELENQGKLILVLVVVSEGQVPILAIL